MCPRRKLWAWTDCTKFVRLTCPRLYQGVTPSSQDSHRFRKSSAFFQTIFSHVSSFLSIFSNNKTCFETSHEKYVRKNAEYENKFPKQRKRFKESVNYSFSNDKFVTEEVALKIVSSYFYSLRVFAQSRPSN